MAEPTDRQIFAAFSAGPPSLAKAVVDAARELLHSHGYGDNNWAALQDAVEAHDAAAKDQPCPSK